MLWLNPACFSHGICFLSSLTVTYIQNPLRPVPRGATSVYYCCHLKAYCVWCNDKHKNTLACNRLCDSHTVDILIDEEVQCSLSFGQSQDSFTIVHIVNILSMVEKWWEILLGKCIKGISIVLYWWLGRRRFITHLKCLIQPKKNFEKRKVKPAEVLALPSWDDSWGGDNISLKLNSEVEI